MTNTGGRRLLTATLAAFVVSCGDGAGTGLEPAVVACVGPCVPSFPVNPHHYLLAVGDTVRLSAHAKTTDGISVPVTWIARGGTTNNVPISVDALGLVRGVEAGKGFVDARTVADDPVSGGGRSEIWVVSPDTSAQPFIALMRDAHTGDTLRYGSVLVGRDSIDIVLSYVIGNFTNTVGTPTLKLQVRIPNSTTEVYSVDVPAPVRGRSATATVRLNLRMKNALGAAVFPSRTYDFYVLLPLADGRVLGDQTGYPAVF